MSQLQKSILLSLSADMPSISHLSYNIFGKGQGSFLEKVFDWGLQNLQDKHVAILLDCHTLSHNKFQAKAFLQWLPVEDGEIRPIIFSTK